MTDEIHPAGAAARIGAYLYRRRKSAQTDYENIHSYDAGCATEAMLLASDLEAVLSALTRANAATAAACEVMAKIADDFVRMRERQIETEKAKASLHVDVRQIMRWQAGKVQSEAISAAIRALATPDQTAALDKLIAEAVGPLINAADAMLAAFCVHENSAQIAAYAGMMNTILAASKKGGV